MNMLSEGCLSGVRAVQCLFGLRRVCVTRNVVVCRVFVGCELGEKCELCKHSTSSECSSNTFKRAFEDEIISTECGAKDIWVELEPGPCGQLPQNPEALAVEVRGPTYFILAAPFFFPLLIWPPYVIMPPRAYWDSCPLQKGNASRAVEHPLWR